jgi:hypothetical protein
MREFNHFYTRFISKYLKPTLYPINEFDQKELLVSIPPIFLEKWYNNKWLNLDKQKQLVEIIRNKAFIVYGFKVI